MDGRRRPILVLSSLDVSNITLRLPVPPLLQIVGDALRSFSNDPRAIPLTPHRSTILAPNYTSLFMPSRVESLATTAIKVVSIPKDGGEDGLPATMLVMDEQTGGVTAVVNARNLTALRTAAASTLATKLCLGEDASPTHLVLFGAGAQSNAHGTLLLTTFPTIRYCTIVNRSQNSRLATLLEHFHEKFPAVEFNGIAGSASVNSAAIERAVKSASIICTATSSPNPLFPSEWVSPNTHINLIGSYTSQIHEVSSELLKRAKILIVDSRAACMQEAGELMAAKIHPGDTRELGELGSELDPRVVLEGDVSIYKSVGVGVMDVAIARHVVNQARELGIGTSIPYD